jgi:NAD-dependent SIR2 family protein deacetylase
MVAVEKLPEYGHSIIAALEPEKHITTTNIDGRQRYLPD